MDHLFVLANIPFHIVERKLMDPREEATSSRIFSDIHYLPFQRYVLGEWHHDSGLHAWCHSSFAKISPLIIAKNIKEECNMVWHLCTAFDNLLVLLVITAEAIWVTICLAAFVVIRAIEVFVHVDYMSKIESAIGTAAITPCVWLNSKLYGEENCETVNDLCNTIKEQTNCNDACDI